MCPVDDIPVHEKVRHDSSPAACKNQPRTSKPLCRQIGRQKSKGGVDNSLSVLHGFLFGDIHKPEIGWEELPECIGCDPSLRDWPYILKSQNDIVIESAKFMKADQRCG